MKIMLKKIRTERGLSQNKLAQLAGTSLQNIQKIEYGKTKGIQYEMLNKLCHILQCHPGDLLVWVPDATSDTQTQQTDSTYSSSGRVDKLENQTGERQLQSPLRIVTISKTLESA